MMFHRRNQRPHIPLCVENNVSIVALLPLTQLSLVDKLRKKICIALSLSKYACKFTKIVIAKTSYCNPNEFPRVLGQIASSAKKCATKHSAQRKSNLPSISKIQRWITPMRTLFGISNILAVSVKTKDSIGRC